VPEVVVTVTPPLEILELLMNLGMLVCPAMAVTLLLGLLKEGGGTICGTCGIGAKLMC
jgi:hypothetical protein